MASKCQKPKEAIKGSPYSIRKEAACTGFQYLDFELLAFRIMRG
jgi:hypothetical protein